MLGTRTYVVLSSDVVIKDLLDKKSNIYSDRPDMYMGQDIASGGLRLVVMVSCIRLKIRKDYAVVHLGFQGGPLPPLISSCCYLVLVLSLTWYRNMVRYGGSNTKWCTTFST